MNGTRYRAWRFIHPDLSPPDEFAGLRISARGGVDMVEGDDSVRQAILLLLSTMPGERVMRPDYGCDLHRLVFSPNDDTTAGLAIHYVRRALERWEPRIEILRLDATRNQERPEQLEISLVYRVRATQRIDQLGISLDLMGEETR
jgi:phage baseplate assembly protein W